MSIRAMLQSSAALTMLTAHKALGDTISYTPKGGVAVTLYAHPGESSRAGNGEDEESEQSFEVAKQTGFPPTRGANMNDEIVSNSVTYRVESWEDISGGYEAAWLLKCVKARATNRGSN